MGTKLKNATNSVQVAVRGHDERIIALYTVHCPVNTYVPTLTDPGDYAWNAFEDDGHGNGDHLGEEFSSTSLARVLELLGEKIVREFY